MSGDADKKQEPVTAASQAKAWLGTAREAVIVMAILALFIWPSWIGDIAVKAGLKEAFGLKFVEQQVEQSKAETSKAQEALAAITEELGQMKDQLVQLSSTVGTSNQAASNQIARITSNVDSLAVRSIDIDAKLRTSMRVQNEILDAARRGDRYIKPKTP